MEWVNGVKGGGEIFCTWHRMDQIPNKLWVFSKMFSVSFFFLSLFSSFIFFFSGGGQGWEKGAGVSAIKSFFGAFYFPFFSFLESWSDFLLSSVWPCCGSWLAG